MLLDCFEAVCVLAVFAASANSGTNTPIYILMGHTHTEGRMALLLVSEKLANIRFLVLETSR